MTETLNSTSSSDALTPHEEAVAAHSKLMDNKMDGKAIDPGGCICDDCGCPGNKECGHEPIVGHCTWDGACPCCQYIFTMDLEELRAIEHRAEKASGQMFMFEEEATDE